MYSYIIIRIKNDTVLHDSVRGISYFFLAAVTFIISIREVNLLMKEEY